MSAPSYFIVFINNSFFFLFSILQVLPTEQRKGFGAFLAAYLCKQVATVEKVVLSAWIVSENFKSKALLEKLGFQVVAKAEWIQLNKA